MNAIPAVNGKKIGKRDVTDAYDVMLDHVTHSNDSGDFLADQSAEAFVQAQLFAALSAASYALAPNLDAIIRSHNATVVRKGAARATVATASATGVEIAESALKTRLAATGPAKSAPVSAPAPTAAEGAPHSADADQNADQNPTAAAAAPENAAMTATAQIADAQITATNATATEMTAPRAASPAWTVSKDGAELIDPMLSAVTKQQIGSIEALIGAIATAEAADAAGVAINDAYVAAIAAYKAEETVDESALGEPAAFTASGFAGATFDSPMAKALDTFLAQNLAPTATICDLVDAVTVAETAVAANATALKALKRDLRMARPKLKTRVETAATPAEYAVDGVDDLEVDVEMVIAQDAFTSSYGATSPILNFEVPKLDFGQAHPDVPKVDPSFRFFSPVLAEALHAIAENEIIWLYGESGCGKSEFWAQVAARLNMPFTRMNMDGHLSRSDIIGVNRLMPDANGSPSMRFQEGILPRAMRNPGILLIDEMDLGDPEIMPILQPVLEGNGLRILEDGGRVVSPHPLFRIAITGNTIGLGSENQMYLNAFEQSAATRDRISAFVQMPYLPPEFEKGVVLARVPSADEVFVEKVIQLANKVREGYRTGELQSVFSTRSVLYCAKRHTRFAPLYNDPHEAALAVLETVVLGRMDGTTRQAVKGFIDNIMA